MYMGYKLLGIMESWNGGMMRVVNSWQLHIALPSFEFPVSTRQYSHIPIFQ